MAVNTAKTRSGDDYRDPGWPRGLTRRQGSYRFRRMVNGRNIQIAIGDVSERQAIEKANEYNVQLAAGVDVVQEERKAQTTLAKFIDAFMEMKKAHTAPKTVARYKAVFDNFKYWLRQQHGDLPLAAVSYEIAQEYLAARALGPVIPNGVRYSTRSMDGRASPWTLLKERDYLAVLFKEAIRRKLVHENPFADVKVKKPTQEQVAAAHHILTPAETDALLDAARESDRQAGETGNARFADVLLFMLKTGMRDDEVRKLEWTDVDFDQELIHIKPKRIVERRVVSISSAAVLKLKRLLVGKAPDDLLYTNTAEAARVYLPIRRPADVLAIPCSAVDPTNRRITFTKEYQWKPKASSGSVPMCETVKNLLRRVKAERGNSSNFVFAHHDGGSCRLDLLTSLKTAQTKAKISGRLRIHDMRHTCAATLRKLGVPLETIMGILRHSDITETLIYAPYSTSEGKKAIRLLDKKPAVRKSSSASPAAAAAPPATP